MTETAANFLDYFKGIRARTQRIVLLVPDAEMEWRPAPERFSFGDLIRHLAGAERYMFAENAACRPSRYPGHGRELADGADAVRSYFDAMHEEAMQIFGGLSDEDLMRKCMTPAGTSITVWKWLRAMIEHEVHHRGQLYLMLGMISVATPPLYGLTEAEVAARSVR